MKLPKTTKQNTNIVTYWSDVVRLGSPTKRRALSGLAEKEREHSLNPSRLPTILQSCVYDFALSSVEVPGPVTTKQKVKMMMICWIEVTYWSSAVFGLSSSDRSSVEVNEALSFSRV